jgi:hypothetical protein
LLCASVIVTVLIFEGSIDGAVGVEEGVSVGASVLDSVGVDTSVGADVAVSPEVTGGTVGIFEVSFNTVKLTAAATSMHSTAVATYILA